MRHFRGSWVMRLPHGVRDQPGWIFIGFLCAAVGSSYMLGFSQSVTVQNVLGSVGLRIWGGYLLLAGTLVVVSTWNTNKALERLALRLLSLGLMLYTCWLILAVPLNRATLTVSLCVGLVGMAEIRVAVLKAVLKPLPKLPGVK